jgi:hypothetical protein
MGDWILLAALQRTEAGALHAYAGKPKETHIDDFPWYITVGQGSVSTPSAQIAAADPMEIPEDHILRIQEALKFQYTHSTATVTPSKQTATGLKGRDKDFEAADHTPELMVTIRKWRKPSFISEHISGRDYGNIMHTVMQHISYCKCTQHDAYIQALIALFYKHVGLMYEMVYFHDILHH